MKIDFLSLQSSTLFFGIPPKDLEALCGCVKARVKTYQRDSFVFHSGDDVGSVYLLISGNVHIVNEDFWGNRSIVETMYEGTLFGEAYVLSLKKHHIVSVVAAEDSVILEMEPEKLFASCPENCACHAKLVQNALQILSKKIVRLTEKTIHIMRRTTREKLLSYLSKCAVQENSSAFYIPYSRQQLADYLCVDRSALSGELSRLQKQGLIKYRKNYFELLVKHDEIV